MTLAYSAPVLKPYHAGLLITERERMRRERALSPRGLAGRKGGLVTQLRRRLRNGKAARSSRTVIQASASGAAGGLRGNLSERTGGQRTEPAGVALRPVAPAAPERCAAVWSFPDYTVSCAGDIAGTCRECGRGFCASCLATYDVCDDCLMALPEAVGS